MKHLFRPCPICDNLNGEVLHKQIFSLQKNSILPNEYDVISCSKCGFVFADTSANQDKYTEYYLSFSKYEDKNSIAASGGGIEIWDKIRLLNTSKYIENFVEDKNKSILDIGCANGGLLLMMKELGYSNLYGLDPSLMCVKNVIEAGIKCEQGDLFELKRIFKNTKFDVIILSHVLEHIYDLKNAISLITNLLSIDGVIYIEVPDASRYLEYYVVPFHYFDVEHINHFDKHFINILFNFFGFSVLNYSQKEIPVSSKNKYPAISLLIRRRKSAKCLEEAKEISLVQNIKSYINLSIKNDNYPEIYELAKNKTPVIIWGAGSYTSRLLENSILKECNITALIYRDIKMQGNQINGIKIYNPEILHNSDNPIIICSALYSDDIRQEILKMRIKNPIFIMK